MSYKNKIQGYKAKVDLEAWQGMENLLDNQAQVKESMKAKSGFLNSIRRWFMLIGIVLILIVGSLYIFSSNQVVDSALSENLGKIETKNEQEQNGNSELTSDNLKGSEPDITSKTDSNAEIKKETSTSEQVKLHDNIGLRGTASSNVETPTRQELKPTEKSLRNNVQSQTESKITSNTSIDELKDKITNIKSDNSEILGLKNTSPSKEEKGTRAYTNDNSKKLESSQNTANDVTDSSMSDQNSEQNSGSISESDDKPSKDESKELDIVSLLDIENIQRTELGLLQSNQETLLGTPDFIKPSKILSKYLVGLDIGEVQYLAGVAGISVSIFGVYEVYPWLRTGLRLNRSDMRDKANYIVSPNITRKKIETVFEFHTQIVPVRIWRFDLGIEGGYGITFVQDKYRRSDNPEPNVITISEEVNNYTGSWFFAGAHATIDITSFIKIGTSVGANIGTESAHFSGRLVVRI